MTDERKFDCSELEAALQEDSPARMAALEAHADVCAACHAELVLWREISAAARTMHKEWNSPGLWPRIAQGLEAEAARPRGWRSWFGEGGPVLRWQVALATVAILMMTVTTAWVMKHRAPAAAKFTVSQPDNKHLLTDQAVQEVEQAEKAYELSIDKLAKLAEPKLENAANPVMVNYREKLQLLDAAISDCRANLDRNTANAYLRKELATFYQEKQKTLEEVLRED